MTDADCPTVVYSHPDVTAAHLRGLTCHRCDEPLADHPLYLSDLVPAGRAYFVDGRELATYDRGPRA